MLQNRVILNRDHVASVSLIYFFIYLILQVSSTDFPGTHYGVDGSFDLDRFKQVSIVLCLSLTSNCDFLRDTLMFCFRENILAVI
jgi:hypothetical protein